MFVVLALIGEEHADGDFQFFVTVSPVPFRSTFMEEDAVEANMTSKSTLRAAAIAFAHRHERVHYFPSYETVVYSDPALAWRPDRVHVQEPMVSRILGLFIDTVYEPGALPHVDDQPSSSAATSAFTFFWRHCGVGATSQ